MTFQPAHPKTYTIHTATGPVRVTLYRHQSATLGTSYIAATDRGDLLDGDTKQEAEQYVRIFYAG